MKKTSLLLYLAFSFCGSISFAQQALTPEVLQTLKESYSHDDAHKAIRNAVNANSIKKLTANSEQAATPDTWFSHKVKSSGISDQKSSGRCWLFTGTNVIRAQVMARTGMKNFFFSQAYNFFYDQLEKSNLFLQGIIDTRKKPIDDKMVEWLFRNPLSDGGQFTGVSDLIEKYGLVPKEVMAETYSSDNTNEFSALLKRKLREDGMLLREASEKRRLRKGIGTTEGGHDENGLPYVGLCLRRASDFFYFGTENQREIYREAQDLHAPKFLQGSMRRRRLERQLRHVDERPFASVQPSI